MPSEISLERWFFYQDAGGLWKWARLDVLGSILAHSGASFATREACVEHARQSGFGNEARPDLNVALPPESPAPAAGLRGGLV